MLHSAGEGYERGEKNCVKSPTVFNMPSLDCGFTWLSKIFDFQRSSQVILASLPCLFNGSLREQAPGAS